MNSNPTDRDIAKFGGTIALVLVLIAAVKHHRSGASIWVDVLIAAAPIFAAACFFAPRMMEPVYRLWMRLAEALGWINTRILLILIFYLVVTPLGLLMRLFGRAPLDMARRDSYWTDPPKNSYGDRHYEKQF